MLGGAESCRVPDISDKRFDDALDRFAELRGTCSIFKDLRPEFGEPQGAGGPFEQPHAKLTLKLGYPPADRGDWHLEAASRLRKASGFNDPREHHQRIEIWHRLPTSGKLTLRHSHPVDKGMSFPILDPPTTKPVAAMTAPCTGGLCGC